MPKPVTRAEFDALYDAVMAINASLEANRKTTGALIEAQGPVGDGLKLLQTVAADAAQQRAALVALLKTASPHCPPALQGAIAAALQALEKAR